MRGLFEVLPFCRMLSGLFVWGQVSSRSSSSIRVAKESYCLLGSNGFLDHRIAVRGVLICLQAHGETLFPKNTPVTIMFDPKDDCILTVY